MDCVEFEVLLFDELDRVLASTDVERMQSHLLTCATCRGLYALVRGDDQHGVTELPHDFAAGVVASTSGRPCERAQLLLSASEDDTPDDGWLLARHLESCADCSAVARVLARLRLDLPTLAEADPGEGFVSEVMAATFDVGRAPGKSQKSWPHRLFEQLVRRPRIALEGAYAIAGLVLVAFGLTSPPFSELPARAAGGTWRFVADAGRTAGEGIGELNAGALALVDQVAETASATAVELGANVSSSARGLARTAWDGLVTPRVEEVRSLWNETVSGAVEPDTRNPKNP